jgi:hypothetical protein
VVGVLKRFEVWAPGTWQTFLSESERLLEDASLDVQWPLAPVTEPTPPPNPQAKPKR